MSGMNYNNPLPINIKVDVHQNAQITVEGIPTINEGDYDYILDVDLAKSFIINGSWVTDATLLGTILQTPVDNVLAHGIKLNTLGNIFMITRDDGTSLLSKDGGSTYKNITIDPARNRLSRMAVTNGYYVAFFLTTTLSTLFTSYDMGATWQPTTIPNGPFPTNSVPYVQCSVNGRIQLLSYSYTGANMTNSSLQSTFFVLSVNYGSSWTPINLNYRQIAISWDSTKIFYIGYGASPSLYVCSLKNIDLTKPLNWVFVNQFSTPTTGYCPIFNISKTGKYITEYHTDSGNTIINVSIDGGLSWTTYTSGYLLNNAYNMDITTMSLSGKIQSYWINDATNTKYLAYSTNYGTTWSSVDINNAMVTNPYGTYDISDNGSHILLYQPNIKAVIYIKLSFVVNDMFDIFTYEQNEQNVEEIDMVVQPNYNNLLGMFAGYTGIYSNNPSVVACVNPYTSLNKKPGIIGAKMLEVIATKIFGNPLTVAAIINDTDYLNVGNTTDNPVTNSIINGITSSISSMGQSFFNQYVGSSLYADDGYGLAPGYGDAVVPLTFNLTDASIAIPLNLSGVLTTPSVNYSAMQQALSLIRNGVNAGGTKVVNGTYNIPFLLKFHYN